MSKKKPLTAFEQAVIDSILVEYQDIPEETELEIDFSTRFQIWSHKLLHKTRNPYWYYVNTTAKKIILVTQEYHIYRALYIAEELGLEAYGVSSDYRTYYNQKMRDAREILARIKDFFYVLFQAEPVYLGEPIPIHGNGDATNDS